MIERLDYHGDLTNQPALAERLAETGLSQTACRDRARLFAAAASALADRGAARRQQAFYVPGRIEVLGKHTDYAGGRSMVVAAERGFSFVVALREGPQVRVVDAVRNEAAEFRLSPELTPRAGHWSNYAMTVARRMARTFPGTARGAEIALASNLPPAAGMSSSSAMIVGMFLALAEVNELERRPEYRQNLRDKTDLAGYLGTIENGQTFGSLEGDCGVGTFGGSEDHTAILCGVPGRISQYGYCPVRFERHISVPEGYTFAIGVSGIVAEKTGAAMARYNAASRLARVLVEIWRQETGRDEAHLAEILATGPDAAARLAHLVESVRQDEATPTALRARLEHFVTEHEQVIPAAGDALARGDVAEFGRLVDRSQWAAEHLLGNQVPQTTYLARSARAAGAAAASGFGAGFGGGVWALIEESAAEAFLAVWADSYRSQFPQEAIASSFFTTAAGPATVRIM